MTDEEIQHLRRLRKATKERLDELKIQAARFGPTRVPAEITIEIRGAEEEIERIDATLRLPTISADVQAATGPEANINVLRSRVEHLGDSINTAMLWMNTQIMEMRNESRDWRAEQEIKRQAGAAFYRLALTVLAAAVVLALALVALVIVGKL